MRYKPNLTIGGLGFVVMLSLAACATQEPEDPWHGLVRPEIHGLAWVGNAPAIAALLSQKPRSIADRDRYGGTALHVAVGYEHMEVVKLLLAKGADVNDNANRDQVTPLHIAAGSGYMDIVDLLLANGADIHIKNKYGQTPLDVADCKGMTDVAYLLREHASKLANLAQARGKDHGRPAPCG
jgi:ankyrin repeat protein